MKNEFLVSSEDIITTEIILNYIKHKISSDGKCLYTDIRDKFYNINNSSNLCRKLKSLKTFKCIDWNNNLSFKDREIVVC